jgi:HK97 family phage portal protein
VAGSSLISRAGGFLRSLVPVRQKQAGYVLPLTGGIIPSDWPLNWWQLGYNPLPSGRSAVVYACVAAYAQTVAMCPGSHWRGRADNGRDRVTNSALARILKRPNPYQTISDFLLNLVSNLLEEGNAYALAIRNNRFEIAELHLMDPKTSRPRVASNGEIFYQLAGNPIVDKLIPAELLNAVPSRDVLHVRWDAKRNPLIGEPPLTNAMVDVAASDMAVRNALAYASNEGRPSGVIETDMTDLGEEGIREIRAKWDERTRGVNAGGTPILTHGLKYNAVNSGGSGGSRDGRLADMLQITDQRIASAYRVPLSMLSLFGSGAQPQGSTEALMQAWIAEGLGFCLNHVEEAIGRSFDLAGQPDEYLEFDTSALLRSLFRDRIEALARGVQGGIYSPNEARALESLPEAEAGDEPRVQQQVVPLSFALEPPPAPAAPPAPPAAAPAADPQPAANDRAAIAAKIREAANSHARRAA